MATDLKRLAALLSLSPTTVSRALNGYQDVSAATRQRVVEAAREHGYLPNPTARRLARGRADAVGIVYPLDAADLGDPCFLQVVEGVSDRLEAAGLDLLLAAARSRAELLTYQRLVNGGRVDGIIVARTRVVDDRVAYLQSVGMPAVTYGRTGGSAALPSLDFDNQAGAELAVHALAHAGHADIAYVHAALELNFAFERQAGFLRGMQALGLALRADAMFDGGMGLRQGYAAGQRLLALQPRPTAVIVDNNLSGVGVLRALVDQRVRVGQDVSVIVYDGVPGDTLLQGIGIASIEQPTAYDTGQTLAEMVLCLIAGQSVGEQHRLRQPVYVPGASVGPAPGRA